MDMCWHTVIKMSLYGWPVIRLFDCFLYFLLCFICCSLQYISYSYVSCFLCHFFNAFFLEVLSSLDRFHPVAELAQVDLDAGAFKKWKEAPQKMLTFPHLALCVQLCSYLSIESYLLDSIGNASVSILWNFWKRSASKTQVRSLPEGSRT